ncbi:hypothetical protein [Pontibacillus marinus]|uniref:Uncharacterized protein n=1 Tax=Pontibacillus marinus BH030004 = DSM 16465 TaxID=1385511 RepID=A0A0A5G3A2_9BACI|nr:hypothetical protein [Pontibacillus marinus]KGX85618.1 hypothetical protein N783_14080 [Pontibacillus marinus BH030004 = DSM 16465]
MSKLDGYMKFRLIFHSFILLFISAVIWAYSIKGFQISYIIIGTVIALDSIYGLFKLYREVKSQNKTVS